MIRRARQQTEAAANKMLAAVNGRESELTTKLETFGKSLVQSEADFNTKVNERLNALQPSLSAKSDAITPAIEQVAIMRHRTRTDF